MRRIALTANGAADARAAQQLLESAGFQVTLTDEAAQPEDDAPSGDAPAPVLQLQRLAALGTVAAGTAHELNNLITLVLSNLYTTRHAITQIEGAGTVTQCAEAVAALDSAVHCCRALQNLSRELSHYGRAPTGTGDRVDLRDVIDNAAALVSPKLPPQQAIARAFEGDLPAIQGNHTKLSQVFVNLLINAVQSLAGQPSDVAPIRVGVRRDGDRVRVDISDSGVGISPSDLPRVFDPFYTTKESEDGVGLGLSVSREIVEEHGGEIEVESRRGAGTTVTVTLPIAAAEME